jgi:anti-sigma regulatory factor (Ser/Thr protein kinase)
VLAGELADAVATVLESAQNVQSRFQVMQSLVHSEYHWKLSNDRVIFGPLIAFLQECLTGLNFCDDTDRTRIGVALEEGLVNAAEHGNLELDSRLRREDRGKYLQLLRERLQQQPYSDRVVQFNVEISRDEARFIVRDEGKGFDPKGLPDPTKPENLLKASGRGVMLMRTFMDEVSYNEIGNEVTMIKRSLAAEGH